MPRNPSISEAIRQPALLTYLTGANNYTWVQFTSGKRVLLSKSLTYFAGQLPHFIRIHKTALINPDFITEIQAPPRPKMAGSVQMQDGTVLPVGRRRWIEVAKQLQQRLDPTATDSLPTTQSETQTHQGPSTNTRTVIAVATDATQVLIQQIITAFEPQFALQEMTAGAALSEWLLLNDPDMWPALIILDARTNSTDRFITLQTLKRHDRLRTIPVIWLAAPGDDVNRAYTLNANSVVVVRNDPTQFIAAVKSLCRYWLTIVRLPAVV